MRGRGRIGNGGNDPGVGRLGWFRVVVPTTHWATPMNRLQKHLLTSCMIQNSTTTPLPGSAS